MSYQINISQLMLCFILFTCLFGNLSFDVVMSKKILITRGIEFTQVWLKTLKPVSSALGTHYETYAINPGSEGYPVLCYILLLRIISSNR